MPDELIDLANDLRRINGKLESSIFWICSPEVKWITVVPFDRDDYTDQINYDYSIPTFYSDKDAYDYSIPTFYSDKDAYNFLARICSEADLDELEDLEIDELDWGDSTWEQDLWNEYVFKVSNPHEITREGDFSHVDSVTFDSPPNPEKEFLRQRLKVNELLTNQLQKWEKYV